MRFQGELSTRLLPVFDNEDELIARCSSSMDNSSGFSLIAYAHLLLNNLLFRSCPTYACVVRVKMQSVGQRRNTGNSHHKHYMWYEGKGPVLLFPVTLNWAGVLTGNSFISLG